MYIFKTIKDLVLKGKYTAIIKTANLNAVVTTEVFKTPQNNLKIVHNELWLTLILSKS